MDHNPAVKEDIASDESLSDKIDMEEWRTWPQLTLLIENIPRNWMIADLKAFLDGFGTVVKAEIFEAREVQTLYYNQKMLT
jgi:hypothetical protein